MTTSPTKAGLVGRIINRLLGMPADGPPWQREDETLAECRRRLGLAANQNPAANPNWIRPRAPQAPPARNPGPRPLTFLNDPLSLSTDDIEQILADNSRLLMENQRMRGTLTDTEELRRQLRDSKHNESLMARRIEAFRKKWPAIHRDFFSTDKGKTHEL